MNAMLEWSEEGRVKLCVALGKAQSEMAPLVKGTENEFFKTQYADLAAVLKARCPLKAGRCCGLRGRNAWSRRMA